jgi:hypothetical protein
MGFLSAGFAELGRKLDRLKLRRKLAAQERERGVALTALGQRAWDERLGLEAHAADRAALEGLDARAGELATTAGTLREEVARLEAQRKAEAQKHAERRKDIETRREPVERALRENNARKSTAEEALRRGETRLPAIATELTSLEREAATMPESDPRRTAAAERRAKLQAEQAAVDAALQTARADHPGLAADNARLAEQSRQGAQELAAAIQEERAALAAIDEALKKARTQLQGAMQQTGAVQGERTRALEALGGRIYESRAAPAGLSGEVARVEAIDRERESIRTATEASMGQTRALPGTTMALFWSVLLGLPLLIAAAFMAYRAWERPASPGGSVEVVDEEAARTRTVERFLGSWGIGGKDTREEALRILRDDAQTLGGSGDAKHLPLLTRLLKSEDAGVRAAAAEAIGMIGATPAETPALLALLKDPDARVVKAAQDTLADSFDPAARAAAEAARR